MLSFNLKESFSFRPFLNMMFDVADCFRSAMQPFIITYHGDEYVHILA